MEGRTARLGARLAAGLGTGALSAAMAAGPCLAKPISLSVEEGAQIGVLCRVFDEDGKGASATMTALCAAAGDIVEQRLAGRRSLVRLGIADDPPGAVDGPIILIAMESRPAWAGGVHPRVLLRTMAVRDGLVAPSVGLPPLPVELDGVGWEERARQALRRMIDFILRDR
ncbi:hypothetical protein [Azospirillum agricola]|uniref:hypothetical protein n=1 Tax=Azospirillum agricola TaxID=1720247 RepID=UPI000A0EF76F|nr:hypothetical protein [Azospirillum agricola]SMH53279.1 hypothetical protein SAMN02982994_3313 [Azospirillum lipoferum]